MMNVPEMITSVSHPLVASIYLKKDYHIDDRADEEDVLVIQTNFSHTGETDEQFDSQLTQLLSDLPELQEMAQEKIGRFDRVDIRTAA